MNKFLHKGIVDWKGTAHDLEFYEADSIGDLGFINQCQAIPFVDEDTVVLYKHADGYYGLPGGTVEKGESFEETLRREVMEESACEVIRLGLIGYFKDAEIPTGKIKYQLRYWAEVKPLDQLVNDPAGRAIGRQIVKFKEVNELLKWGDRGQILLDSAKRKYAQAMSKFNK